MSRAWLAALVVTVAVPALVAGRSPDRPTPPAHPASSQQAPPERPPQAGQPARAPSQPQAIFKAGVELVRLDVRAVDGQGLPVRDLRADEVQVFEGGARRPVVLFQHVAEPIGTYLEAARRTIGAEVSTNQGSPRGHLYLVVFDQNHITAGNEVRARQAVERFLRTRVKPGDRVALYALPGPGPQLPFTGNVSQVIGELLRIRGSLDRQGFSVTGLISQYEAFEITRGNPEILQRVLNRAADSAASGLDFAARSSGINASAPASATDSASESVRVAKEDARTIVARADTEAHTFLLMLSDVIRELARIEGRKSVILVSEGFFTDNLVHDVERVAAAAAASYAVIYSLDINRHAGDINAVEPTGAGPAQEIRSRLESLGTLAAETSGELMIDAGSHIDQVMNRIANSSQDYYVVGFEPPAEALAGRQQYRRVTVKVTRPGTRVSARTGYAMGDPITPADRRRSIDVALGAPYPQQGLPLEMTTYVLHGTSPGVQRVVMSLQADLPVAADVSARPADVVFVARDARDGRVVASGSDVMPLPRAPAPGQTPARGQFRVQFDVPAGEYLLRVAVREPGGATGTVDRRFDVRPLDGVDMTASDLIMARRDDGLPVRARGYVDEGITGTLEVYARNAADLERIDVTVGLVPVGGTAAVRSIKADLLDIRKAGSGARRTAQVMIPLDGVAPGDYVARATVRAGGETVTELMRQVEVAPGSPAPEAAPPPERVTPGMILAGELGRRFVAAIGKSATDPAVEAAVGQASLGAWDKVAAQLGEATGSPSAGVAALQGLASFAQERYGQAAASLEAALVLEPGSAYAAFFLGWARANAGKGPEAITAWRNAVLNDPTMISAYLALADGYAHLGHPELAVQVVKDGLRTNPSSPELRSKLAEIERR